MVVSDVTLFYNLTGMLTESCDQLLSETKESVWIKQDALKKKYMFDLSNSKD